MFIAQPLIIFIFATEPQSHREKAKKTILDDGLTPNSLLPFSVDLCVSVADVSLSRFMVFSVALWLCGSVAEPGFSL
jgi:hypothetical protein